MNLAYGLGGAGGSSAAAIRNRLVWSDEHQTSSWSKTDTTVSADTQTDHQGYLTANLLTAGTAGTDALFQTVPIDPSRSICVSQIAKRGNNDWLFVQLSGSGTERLRGWFNLATGAAGSGLNVSPATGAAVSVEDLGGGHYRCALSGKLNGAGSTCQYLSAIMTADQSLTRINSSTRIFGGSQVEYGTTPSAYQSRRI